MKTYILSALIYVVSEFCLVYCNDYEDRRIRADDWNRWYERLFGNDNSCMLDEGRVLVILIWLESGSYEPIDESKRDIARFWYDANLYNECHRSDHYMDILLNRYTEHVPSSNNGIDAVFDSTYESLTAKSDVRFVDLREAPLSSGGTERATDNWRYLFDELFGANRKYFVEARLLRHLIFMHALLADTYLCSFIPDDEKSTVLFWYNSLQNTVTKHCNVQHINYIYQHVEYAQHLNNLNLITMFKLVYRSLVEYCSDMFLDLSEFLNENIGSWRKAELEQIQNYFHEWAAGTISKEIMDDYLIEKVKDSHDASPNITVAQAWKDGPCGKLETSLSEFRSRNFTEFVELVHYNDLYSSEFLPFEPIVWARIVNSCRKLEPTNTNASKKVNLVNATIRFVKSCFTYSPCLTE